MEKHAGHDSNVAVSPLAVVIVVNGIGETEGIADIGVQVNELLHLEAASRSRFAGEIEGCDAVRVRGFAPGFRFTIEENSQAGSGEYVAMGLPDPEFGFCQYRELQVVQAQIDFDGGID